MKRIALAASLVLAAPLASADFLAIYGGLGQWNTEFSGELGSSDTNIRQLGFRDSDNGFFYVGLEHFIPLVPNVRLQRTNLSDARNSTLTSNFTLDGQTFTADTDVRTEIDLSHTDAVLYYQLLDNWISLDLGLALRKFDGFASVTNRDNPAQSERVNIRETIPMLYGGAQFDFPMTGWYVGVDAYLISVGDNKITDFAAKAGYTFSFVAVDMGLELGYRDLTIEYDEDTTADITFKGVYLGATLRF
jgi:outer membrane protein